MKIILQEGDQYILSFARGEELMTGLKEFAEENNIKAAVFSVIGAAQELELAWYDVDVKQYTKQSFFGKYEIASLIGNIATMQSKIIVHNHGVFSDREMKTIGGHMNKLVVAAACEIHLQKLEGKLEREYSEEIGLNLLCSINEQEKA